MALAPALVLLPAIAAMLFHVNQALLQYGFASGFAQGLCGVLAAYLSQSAMPSTQDWAISFGDPLGLFLAAMLGALEASQAYPALSL